MKLFNKISNINMEKKSRVSLDMKSLYINIYIKKVLII